eukprot:1542254-Pleurochrysis_carterae.AAC.3
MECWRSLPVAAKGPRPARQGERSCIGRLRNVSKESAKKPKDWQTIRLICVVRCIRILCPARRSLLVARGGEGIPKLLWA